MGRWAGFVWSTLASGLRRSFVWRGRARRAEMWTFWVTVNVGVGSAQWASLQAGSALAAIGIGREALAVFWGVVALALMPSLVAMSVRRLHDRGWGAVWALVPWACSLVLVVVVVFGEAFFLDAGRLAAPGAQIEGFVVGWVLAFFAVAGVWAVSALVLLVLLVLPGNPGENRYGPAPCGAGAWREE